MSIVRFLNAVGKHWWTLMSCAVFTLLGMWVLYASKNNGWALQATFGLAVFCLFWACFLAWRDEERKVKELEGELRTLKASAIVPPVQNNYFSAPPVPAQPEPLKHNVQCVGFKHIVFNPLLPELTAAALCYQNVPIIGEQIGEFYSARLKVSFHLEGDGEDVTVVFPAKWIDSDSSAITIDVISKSAIIASCIAGRWGADRLIDPERGWVYNNVESVKLPVGRIEIIATLFGQSNLSVPPYTGVLTLREDGSSSFTKTQKQC
jgi:hypothetical protein